MSTHSIRELRLGKVRVLPGIIRGEKFHHELAGLPAAYGFRSFKAFKQAVEATLVSPSNPRRAAGRSFLSSAPRHAECTGLEGRGNSV